MLDILGHPYRHCDGVTRRGFLRVGAIGAGALGGLTLADILKAEHDAGRTASNKAIINIHLDGGPPQMDTIDLKPDLPSEFRGDFNGIPTKIPGFHVCELMPKIASIADQFAFIRTLVGSIGKHHAYQCQSGFDENSLRSLGGRPAMGSVVSHLLGKADDPAPAFVDLMQGRPLVRNSARPGFLGPGYAPFRPDLSDRFKRPLEPGMVNELAARGNHHTARMTLIDSLSADRLADRTALAQRLDTLKKRVENHPMMDAMDRFHQQAAGVLTSGKLAAALDLDQEDPGVVKRYTPGPDRAKRFTTSEGPQAALKFLLARRLIEAGVRVVSVSLSDFDTHSSNFARMRQLLPILDHGLHALITDLQSRGMLSDVTVVAWGEFGRTPRINKRAGRDHWPRVSPALIAGGGVQTGQVIGATDRYAGEPAARPVHFQDVIATCYHNLGLDPQTTTIQDTTGRPQYLTDHGQPIRELVG